jgi:Pvc16 N-terminal domain
MGLAPLGVLDLSLVTNTLINLLEKYVTTLSPLWTSLGAGGQFPLSFSGAMPDAVRKQPGCQLTFSLFHVTEDKFQRNSALLNQRAQMIPFQPMALDLYYLLSAFADHQYQHEQQAMSMAVQFFYQTPIVKTPVTLPGIVKPVDEEFVLTMEIETSDELARLWQAITVPMRLAVVYKVSVVLMTPPATPALAPPVVLSTLAAEPAVFPDALSGQLLGSVRTVTYAALTLPAPPAPPTILSVDYSPAVAVPGPLQHFNLYGANLNLPTSNNVYLTMPDGTEFNVSNWMVPEPNPEPVPNVPTFQTKNRTTLQLPLTMGAPPANTPPAGLYQLSAGCDAPTKYRTNAVPFYVGAWVDASSVPQPNPPIIGTGVGPYTVNGEGFVAGATEVLVETIALGAADFNVASAAQLTFTVPAFVTKGTYLVRIRVNNVESPPAWWVVIP